ncbi:MAG: UDP-N-acetylglucosamine 2-epimerase (hydrolyzing) [Rhodocyclaceae bacterium]|nr:UDP-N-acetylglucosamine 2-epimerase (hydrolyzing) [Rhodocyclaceae bacterium]
MKARRCIAVATVARSDFGLYQPLLERIAADPALELRLLVSGAHFDPRFGPTVREIETAGYAYEPGLAMHPESDDAAGVAQSLGQGVKAFAQAFGARRPDLLVLLGDRTEMLAPALAALPFNIPQAHLYGGKVTEGAIDERVRHALTKMSHLHFVSCQAYAERVLQMGEEPWRVFNYGSPGLDRIHGRQRPSREALCKDVGLDPAQPFLLVTFHPVTLEPGEQDSQVAALLQALEQSGLAVVATYPNADAGSVRIAASLEAFAARYPRGVRLLRNAGSRLYADLMAHAVAMVGNSSSGIGEAPSFELPVVNIGSRQDGAIKAANVIDVGYAAEEVQAGIRRATDSAFRAGLRGLRNPYGDGNASGRIAATLRDTPLDDRLLRKKFVDLPLRA